MLRRFGQLDALLGREGGSFFGGGSPAIADYFVYESVSRGRAVFGQAFESSLRGMGRLSAQACALEERPRLAACLLGDSVPFRVTASPSEPRLRPRILAELGG